MDQKKMLMNKLYASGQDKVGLPSVVKANPQRRPQRAGGLQPRNAASSQTRLSTNS